MHTIRDIAISINDHIEIIDLDRIIDAQDLEDKVNDCKKANRFILLYAIDNYRRQRDYVEQVRQTYENFAFTTSGIHDDSQHISNVDYLSRDSCDPKQPMVDHTADKLYRFVFLVGQLHGHRWDLLLSMARKGLLDDTLLSLQNYDHAHSHLVPKVSRLADRYEWPEILELGGYQQQHQVPSPMSLAIAKYNGIVMPTVYQDTGCSIISETNIDKGIVYLTEKTWIPIVAEHLPLIQGNAGTTDFLHRLGFDLRYEGIPEYENTDHDTITDICLSLTKKEIKRIYQASEQKRRQNREWAMDEQNWIDYHVKQLKSFGGPFA